MKRLIWIMLVSCSVIMAGVAIGDETGAGVTDSGLRASIIADSFYYAGEPVEVTFRLENISDEDFILQEWSYPATQRRWYLQLEKDAETTVEFEVGLPLVADETGRLSRNYYGEGEYLIPATVWQVIKAGEHMDVTLDLADNYDLDLTEPGNYSVASLYASFRAEGELTEENWPEELAMSWDGWQQHPMPPRVWEGVLFPNTVMFTIGHNYAEPEAEISTLQMHEVVDNDEPVVLPNIMRPLSAVHPDEPAQYTYNYRFSPDEAMLDMEMINEALEGFRLLTDDAHKAGIIEPGAEYFPMTGWEEQHLGFPNWTGAVEGTIRKQRMEMAQLRAELAALKLQNGTGSREEAVAAEEELRIATQEFVVFWDSFGIAD